MLWRMATTSLSSQTPGNKHVKRSPATCNLSLKRPSQLVSHWRRMLRLENRITTMASRSEREAAMRRELRHAGTPMKLAKNLAP